MNTDTTDLWDFDLIFDGGSNSFNNLDFTSLSQSPVYEQFSTNDIVQNNEPSNTSPQSISPVYKTQPNNSGGTDVFYFYPSVPIPNEAAPVQTVTLNPNNFVAPSTTIRYIKDDNVFSLNPRKRPSEFTIEPESLLTKRQKNREAARRWRQGKKDQLLDLQDEVYRLRSRIEDMQSEMDILRNENFGLRKELETARKTDNTTQTNVDSPNNTGGLNLLSTPSLFLLCIFLFSFTIFLPSFHQSTSFDIHPLMTRESTRLPRILATVPKKYEGYASSGISQQTKEWNLPTLIGINLDHMNKKLSTPRVKLDNPFGTFL